MYCKVLPVKFDDWLSTFSKSLHLYIFKPRRLEKNGAFPLRMLPPLFGMSFLVNVVDNSTLNLT
jgi:hypothetical protein